MTDTEENHPEHGDAGESPRRSDDVHVVDVGGRQFILVGTAHISQQSVDLVREVIEKEKPDCVCIELDAQRYEALSQERRFEGLDLREVIKKRQLAALLMNLMLASYQKRLGGKLGVTPGTELLEAARAAEDHDIPISLCDRDIRVTLRRAWAALSWWKKARLVVEFMASTVDAPELSEEELERIKEKDVLTELMDELGRAMPEIKRVLIDERDAYLAQKIRDTAGDRLVAVVGAGHVAGMQAALLREEDADLESINVVPAISPIWKWAGWAIPAFIVGALGYIGWTKGGEAAGENALYWFFVNAIPTGLGAIAALAHPATIVAAFFSAPFTSLTPVIGAGYVAAFVQAWSQPPRVHEFQSVGDDIGNLGHWWRSRLLKVFLVFILTTLGSIIGTYAGAYEIIKNLF